MGLFKLLRYARAHRLVTQHTIATPPGVVTPIAVDLWNVMYTLMEKTPCPDAHGNVVAEATARCLLHLLRTLGRRAYFPIFVSDRGIAGDGRATRGAKAIVSQTMARVGGSGRVEPLLTQRGTDEEVLRVYEYIGSPDSNDEDDAPLPASSVPAVTAVDGPAGNGDGDDAVSPGAGRCGLQLAHQLCIELIRRLGYAYVDAANLEADDICANLFHTNTVAQVYSTDTDMILTGCDLVLDIAPLFPPVLRCRDVLASLEMPYGRFLATFVRCHTDLHRPPVLKSVPQVTRALCTGRSLRLTADATPTWRPRVADGGDADGAGNGDEDPLQTTTRRTVARHSVRLKYASRYPPIVQTCADAAWLLPPTRTKGDVLEKKFVAHVISTIVPRRRHGVSLLKRVPIHQEHPNVHAAHVALARNMRGDLARSLMASFQKHLPPPPCYHAVLAAYWDDGGDRDEGREAKENKKKHVHSDY